MFAYKTAEVGGGRHVWDPIQTPANLERYLKWLWFGQLFNLYGMALIKLSICAYILMLDFSRAYRIVIWLSVVLHVGINFVFPSIILLGECQPISKHWDVAAPGTCWGDKPRVISGMCHEQYELQSRRLTRSQATRVQLPTFSRI